MFQNICIVLWKKFDDYDPEGSFYTWACKMAYIEVLRLRRNSKRLQVFSEEVLSLLADNMISRIDDLDSRQQQLERCLAKLTSKEKELVRERYYLRLAPKEIAAAKSVSVHSVYRALVRVHASLRNCIELSLAKERQT